MSGVPAAGTSSEMKVEQELKGIGEDGQLENKDEIDNSPNNHARSSGYSTAKSRNTPVLIS